MNTLDTNIFTEHVCPHLTGKTIDDMFLVNKQYHAIVKANTKHFYRLFWVTKERMCSIGYTYIERYKDEKLEREQLSWYPLSRYPSGQLSTKEFYKGGEKEGEEICWWDNGQLMSKSFYKEGKQEGEQLIWYRNGQLESKKFYKDGKEEGEELRWYSTGQLFSKKFYKEGKFEGEHLEWYSTGQLLSKEFYNNGIRVNKVSNTITSIAIFSLINVFIWYKLSKK